MTLERAGEAVEVNLALCLAKKLLLRVTGFKLPVHTSVLPLPTPFPWVGGVYTPPYPSAAGRGRENGSLCCFSAVGPFFGGEKVRENNRYVGIMHLGAPTDDFVPWKRLLRRARQLAEAPAEVRVRKDAVLSHEYGIVARVQASKKLQVAKFASRVCPFVRRSKRRFLQLTSLPPCRKTGAHPCNT